MAINARVAMAALSLSAAAFVGILTREGYTDGVIIPVPGDKLTIGFGTTEGVRPGDRTTPVRAAQRALADTQKYQGAVKQCVQVPLYQAEYDAYIDLAYNIGTSGFCNSEIVRRLNEHDYAGACESVLKWKMFKGFDCSTPGNTTCAGLWKDRLRTHAMCVAP